MSRKELFLVLAGLLLATELNAQPVGAQELWFSSGDD
jgi:hypothetical protein